MTEITVTELEGDGIGPELQQSVAAVAGALPIDIAFDPIDWSLETRERSGEKAIDAAEASMRKNKLALKYPTVTKTRSPNALIRQIVGLKTFHRFSGHRIPLQAGGEPPHRAYRHRRHL